MGRFTPGRPVHWNIGGVDPRDGCNAPVPGQQCGAVPSESPCVDVCCVDGAAEPKRTLVRLCMAPGGYATCKAAATRGAAQGAPETAIPGRHEPRLSHVCYMLHADCSTAQASCGSEDLRVPRVSRVPRVPRAGKERAYSMAADRVGIHPARRVRAVHAVHVSPGSFRGMCLRPSRLGSEDASAGNHDDWDALPGMATVRELAFERAWRHAPRAVTAVRRSAVPCRAV